MTDWTLQDWADFGTALGPVATFATLVVAALAWGQLRSLKRQVAQGQAQVDQGHKALEIASESARHAADAASAARAEVQEAARSRADTNAHRVVVLLEAFAWPPMIHQTRHTSAASPNVFTGEPRLVGEGALSDPARPDGTFVLSRHANQLLWIPVRGVILNEGASTAVITLNGETIVVSDESVLFPGEKPISKPPELGTSFVHPQYLLGPGQKMLFAWGTGHLVKDWIAGFNDEDGPAICELLINVEDISQARVVDEIRVQLAATLLFPTDDEDTWALTRTPKAHAALMVRPSPRRYINEST